MTKANKKSLDAKAYINAQVNEMREKISKAPDEEIRQNLIETFNELTSSDEYQENLAVVQEDTDIVREYVKRKKGGDITPEEFDLAKTEFYGKNMNLEFGEDFEKLDLGKKVDYIFEKFGDTNYAADLIIDILHKILLINIKKHDDLEIKKWIIKKIFNKEYKNNKDIENIKRAIGDIKKKFGMGPIGLKLCIFFGDTIDGKYYSDLFHEIYFWWEQEGTYDLLKFIKKGTIWYDIFSASIKINDLEEGFYVKNKGILDAFIRAGIVINFGKLDSDGQKYFIYNYLKNRKNIYYLFDRPNKYDSKMVLSKDIDLGEGTDSLEYIFIHMVKFYSNSNLSEIISHPNFGGLSEYHKKIADLLIKNGKVELLKKKIDKFTGLTEIEKAEILGNTEVEDRLNKKKFDSDLAKLQELGEKLGLIIKVEEKEKE